jgi:hypothetical protein
MVQVIGLGRGEQNAIDLRPEQRAEQRAAADPEAIENSGQRRLEVDEGLRPRVERGEGIDQNHLAVKPGKMIPEERANHDVLVGLIAPAHHRPQRSSGCFAMFGHIERREGERRRTCEIARHQEAARRQQAHREALVAAGA